MSNVSKDLVVTHLAIFERSMGTYNKDYVASCVTFMSRDRVPAGINYNVTYFVIFENAKDNQGTLFQPGIYVNAFDASKVMVYVHNANQECYNICTCSYFSF